MGTETQSRESIKDLYVEDKWPYESKLLIEYEDLQLHVPLLREIGRSRFRGGSEERGSDDKGIGKGHVSLASHLLG